MAKKNKSKDGIIYSTDPSFSFEEEEEVRQTLPPSAQKLKVKTDSKHRAGKLVTLVTGFVGKTEDLEALGKQLKTSCGTGGAVKDGEIIIQGDQKTRILQWLKKEGYQVS